ITSTLIGKIKTDFKTFLCSRQPHKSGNSSENRKQGGITNAPSVQAIASETEAIQDHKGGDHKRSNGKHRLHRLSLEHTIDKLQGSAKRHSVALTNPVHSLRYLVRKAHDVARCHMVGMLGKGQILHDRLPCTFKTVKAYTLAPQLVKPETLKFKLYKEKPFTLAR